MKLHVCIFLAFLVCCLSDIITEYRYLQQNSDVTELDILHCQLRANGNNSCAFRFDTTTTNGVWEERERCEELGVDWCNTGTLEAGFAYVGKSAVSRTPPFSFNYYVSGGDMLWEMSEDIPIAIKAGAQLTIQFTAPVAVWSQIRLNFRNEVGVNIYGKIFMPGGLISSGVESTVTAVFDPTEIRLYVQGTLDPSGNIGTVTDIRTFQFAFVDNPGDIHRVSYKAAP